MHGAWCAWCACRYDERLCACRAAGSALVIEDLREDPQPAAARRGGPAEAEEGVEGTEDVEGRPSGRHPSYIELLRRTWGE